MNTEELLGGAADIKQNQIPVPLSFSLHLLFPHPCNSNNGNTADINCMYAKMRRRMAVLGVCAIIIVINFVNMLF